VVVARDPVEGRWDRARVKQIISNLVSNAIRHSGGGRIELSVRSSASDGEIVIDDRGPGIEPTLLPRLFELDHGIAQGSGRHGMGLWVVKALCSAMRGAVTVENRSGGGARFCVVLPRG
jgi:signal transduction histidine kinase